MPMAREAPSRAAALAGRPDRVPASRTVAPVRSIACRAARHSRVVAWCPVPKPMDGGIVRQMGLGIGDSGLGGFGKIVIRPTVTGGRFSCDRRAHSSSGTSTAATSKCLSSCARAASRTAALGKKTRTTSFRSSIAVGEKSSTSARSRSVLSGRTSSAGYVTRSPNHQSLSKHVLDAVEQIALVLVLVARARLELFFRQRLGKILEHAPLVLGQLLRRLHLHRREEIAAAAAVDVGHAFAAQTERRAGLRPLRNLDGFGVVERRHLDVAAEREGREVDGNLAEQVIAVAAEKIVFAHVHDHVQVSGGSTHRSGFSFALQPELLTGCDAGRDLDRDLSLFRRPSRAAACLTRLADDAAGSAALRTGSRDLEESLLVAHLTLPAALRTGGRRRTGRRAGSFARLAVLFARNLDRRFRAARRFLEPDLEVVPQIGSALGSAAAPSAEQVAEAEHVAENVGEIAELGEHRRVESGARARGGADALMAEPIVQIALLGVRQHGVRLGALLEFLLGGLIARIAIRVVLRSELAVGALDFDFRRGPADFEDLVVIALAHAFATLTIAGRRRRSPIMYPLRSSPITSLSRWPGLASCMTAW